MTVRLYRRRRCDSQHHQRLYPLCGYHKDGSAPIPKRRVVDKYG
nr:MAG TPA: Ribonucleotide reductase inhibitor [Caudoviricetes sp.]